MLLRCRWSHGAGPAWGVVVVVVVVVAGTVDVVAGAVVVVVVAAGVVVLVAAVTVVAGAAGAAGMAGAPLLIPGPATTTPVPGPDATPLGPDTTTGRSPGTIPAKGVAWPLANAALYSPQLPGYSAEARCSGSVEASSATSHGTM